MSPPPDRNASSAVRHLIESGLAGVATLDGDGAVLSREGVLSSWLPEVGRSCFESPILSGLDGDIEALRHPEADGEPLILPGIRLAMVRALPRCDIAISWNGDAAEHAVLTTVDQIDRPIDHWVVQQKREQRLLEEEIVAASRELERINGHLRQFTSVAAHDLQAPLRQISAYTRVLRRELSANASSAVADCLDTVEGCAKRLTTMIAGLLDLARLGSNRLDLEAVALGDALEAALHNLGVGGTDPLSFIEVDPLPTVEGSHALLTNLFQNLIGNSLRYASPDRDLRVKVACVQAEGRIGAITIADNGIGIDPAYADRIFEGFVRVPNRAVKDGVGLGLGIARRIAELHGWCLDLDRSHAPGACFAISLAPPLKIQRSR